MNLFAKKVQMLNENEIKWAHTNVIFIENILFAVNKRVQCSYFINPNVIFDYIIRSYHAESGKILLIPEVSKFNNNYVDC